MKYLRIFNDNNNNNSNNDKNNNCGKDRETKKNLQADSGWSFLLHPNFRFNLNLTPYVFLNQTKPNEGRF